MDSRLTLHTDETFLHLLNTSFQSGEKVNLLIDDGGISRMEGYIKAVNSTDQDSFIELDDTTIELKKIVAVNGIFRPEYGEC